MLWAKLHIVMEPFPYQRGGELQRALQKEPIPSGLGDHLLDQAGLSRVILDQQNPCDLALLIYHCGFGIHRFFLQECHIS